jgi:hypothetical protein
MEASTTGSNNVAMGVGALGSSTTASNNTALGHNALLLNTTGTFNVAVGSTALDANTTASNNNAVGYGALGANTTGSHNNAFGTSALAANTTATRNTVVGSAAGDAITTGSTNTLMGYVSGGSLTTGYQNVAMGDSSLSSATTAINNVALGQDAASQITTGTQNVAIGAFAGDAITTNSNCTVIGYNAFTNGVAGAGENTAVGMTALGNVTNGPGNTGVGQQAGQYSTPITTGQGNTCLGAYTHVSTGNAQFQISIGYNVQSIGNNTLTFGKNTGNDRVHNTFISNASWTRVSDVRYKENITPNTDCGLAFINDLNPVTFTWKAKADIDNTLPDYDAEATEPEHKEKLYGLIAQEVKEALDKHNITDFGGWDKEESSGIQAISQEMFIHPLIKAIQELSAKVEELESKLNGE